ncbi:MAG: discoidin domain-containing protein, partial [Candidatus Symbiothrix sp.]|nr:discoidin domain-containing protein [Candidatus Symbiothrix sp.]
MKKIIYGVLLAVFCLFTQEVRVYAQSDCDIVFDFESGSYSGNKVTITTVTNTVTNGINTSNTCIQVELPEAFATAVVKFLIDLPAGKTFEDVFTTLKFQLLKVNNDLYGKNTIIAVSDDGTNWTEVHNSNPTTNITSAWAERSIDISTLNTTIKGKTGTFYLGIGIKSEKDTKYYMDNVQLVADPNNCITVDPDEDATLNSLTVTPGTLTPAFAAATT